MNYELNKRIAAEVLGYQYSPPPGMSVAHWWKEKDGKPYYWKYTGLPDYSGDIGTAWQVVKELNKRGVFLATLKQAPSISEAGTKWFAVFTNIQLQPEGVSDWVDSAALAICYAALDICEKLKGQEKEKP